MAVHGALAELSRRFDRPRLSANAEAPRGTVLPDTRRIGFEDLLCGENAHALALDPCSPVGTVDESVVGFHRGSVDTQLASMVKLAVELSRRDRVDSGAPLHPSVARQAHRAVAGERGERIGAVRTFLRRPLWLVSRVGAVMLVSTLGAGTAFATADALPDDPLHEAKLATEQLRLTLAQSPEQRVAVELDIAGARLHEAVVLGTQGRDTSAEVAVSGYGEHLANAAATLQEIQPGPPAVLVEQLRAQVARQQESVSAAQRSSPSDESLTALRILSEVGTTVARGGDVGPERIADSAALAAAKAAASVQRRAEPSMNVGGSAALSVAAASAAPAQPASPIPTASAAAGNAGSAPTATTATTAAVTSTQAPAVVVVTQSSASNAAPATTSAVAPLPPVAPAAVKDKKTEAAAKAATESAERAKHAAERAKQAAEKSARDAEHAKK
jgi:uncharacterized protein DUF5667